MIIQTLPRRRIETPKDWGPRWWVDFSNVSSLTISGSDINGAADLTGNGHHFALGGTGGPPQTGATHNGLAVASFTPNDKLENINDYPAQPHTMVAVGAHLANLPGNGFDRCFLGARRNQGGQDHHISINGRGFGRWQNGNGQINGGAAGTTPHLSIADEDFTRNPKARFYLDGSLVGTANNLGGVEWNSLLRWTIGGVSPDDKGNTWLNGWVGEVFVLPYILTDSLRASIETYFKQKWNV